MPKSNIFKVMSSKVYITHFFFHFHKNEHNLIINISPSIKYHEYNTFQIFFLIPKQLYIPNLTIYTIFLNINLFFSKINSKSKDEKYFKYIFLKINFPYHPYNYENLISDFSKNYQHKMIFPNQVQDINILNIST